MSLFGDYTEDIPVKISERFKPPPRIELGRSESECEERARRALLSAGYGFTFEHRVLDKLAELRAAKETLLSERRHRLRLRDEAAQRRLDELAAAEAEERLCQLSVSRVSYPSGDDFGDPSDVDAADEGLLRPTREPAPAPHPLDDEDPLLELRRAAAASALRHPRRHLSPAALSVSDFEHDTSSPFDDAELQSIDALAQLELIMREPSTAAAENLTCDDSGYYAPVPPHAYDSYVQPYTYWPLPPVPEVPAAPPASRSRSVPDIVRELSEEVACERLRAAAPAPAPALVLNSAQTPASAPAPALARDYPPAPPSDAYSELAPRLQEMCRSIEGMGFPRERVATVCSLLGDSDKKVIEGLLLVGQLLDLGFPESRVAAALAKHHFNRDAALDELIA